MTNLAGRANGGNAARGSVCIGEVWLGEGLGPLTLAHERLDDAGRGDAVDVEAAGADHPVDVDEAVVGALGGELLGRKLVAIAHAGGVGLAERNVRGGVLVEERIEEKHAACCDGRRVGDERDFAETACAFVGANELLENFLAACGASFDDAAFFKADLDDLKHGALMGKRLGGGDGAVGSVLVGRGEDFFRGHVGDAVETVAGRGAAAEPEMIVGQAETEIGSGASILQGGVTLFIETRGARLQRGVVSFPGGNGIGAVDARGLEDRVPEFGEGDVWRVIGKDGRGPGRRCAGNDGPVDGVARDEFESRTVGQRDSAIGAADLGGIFVGEQGRVAACDGQTRGAAFEGSAHAVVEPGGGAVEARVGSEAVAHENGFVVGVESGNKRSAGAIGLLCDAVSQRQGIERGGHEQLLAGLEAEADADGDFSQLIEFVFVRAG